MSILECPLCSEQVVLPQGASSAARVRCPLCQEEYPLADALQQMPPTLIVIEDPNAGAAAADAPLADAAFGGEPDWPAPVDAAPTLAAAEAPTLSPADAPTLNAAEPPEFGAPQFAVAGGDEPAAAPAFAASDPPTARKPSVRSSSRRRPKKGGGVKSAISIVLGGLMAVPIAQLILWWALPESKKVDFGMGPSIARIPVVGMLVPAKFRGDAASDDGEEVAAGDGNVELPDSGFSFNDNGGAQQPPKRKRKRKQPPPEPQQQTEPPAQEPPSQDDAATDVATTPPSQEEPEMAQGTENNNVFASPLEVAAPSITIDDPLNALNTTPEPVTPAAPSAGTLTGDEPTSASDLAKHFAAAAAASIDWDDSPLDTDVRRHFYTALTGVGHAMAGLDPRDRDEAEQMKPEIAQLLREIGKHADKHDLVAKVGPGWANNTARPNDGIAVSGRVISGKAIGDLVEVEIQPDAGPGTLTIVGKPDDAEPYQADSRVLIVGRIVADSAAITGYEGDAKNVILEGVHVTVASE